MQLKADGCVFEIDGDSLAVSRDSATLMRLPLIPRADGVGSRNGDWKPLGDDHFAADVAGLGSVHIGVREGHVCYWIETDRKHFPALTYFPGSHPTDTGWHTFLSDELDRYWSIDEDADVPLSSAYMDMHVDKEDGAGMTDPGDKPPTWIWNIPARAFAIETPAGWMGMSIPGPLSVGVTRLTMEEGTFNLTFEELRPTAAEWGPPRVYFVPGLADPYDTLDHHRVISERCGLTRTEVQQHPEWWAYPSFKCWDEVYRLNDKKAVLNAESGDYATFFTTDNWLRWIEHVEDYAGIEGRMNLQLDQIFFRGYGGRKVISNLGGTDGLRKTIDELRERGLRVGLYIHLYVLDPSATDFPARHPEAICNPKDPDTRIRHGVPVGDHSLVYLDWTHPEGRRFMLDYVEWLLSDKPGCLNADWLLVNNNVAPDPRKFEFHDPDWGIGDLMSMKATKLVYERAKQIKPDCCVRRQSPGDPYMQPYCDAAHLCEDWTGQSTAWYRRANIATRLLKNVIVSTDSWFMTLSKIPEYYFALAAICPPEIQTVEHAIHPYMYWRIRAGVQTYLNAPARKADECGVNSDRSSGRLEIWRKHGSGPLAGWYAALAPHKRVLITYGEHEARVTASQKRRITVPLPPGSKVKSVEAVTHDDGPAQPHDFEMRGTNDHDAVVLWVPDSAGGTMYVRIIWDRHQ